MVRRIAMLARLELGERDEVAVTEQLDHILQHFETLAALDTANVAPTAHVVDMTEAYREDVVTNLPAAEALRANAPARDGDFFKVPKIIE
ncbi:MAG: Asp-tRNA(Asn)/Glu-tRNA(Gln) amidotransferase GatCAB subunit [Deltaproteobacteria bacterium]|nr:Asp-tRNA(Asn)/Glu-tRNA(Gln) amidotransferase GatCAB subunit [Deltaproteobacteria bacterium]